MPLEESSNLSADRNDTCVWFCDELDFFVKEGNPSRVPRATIDLCLGDGHGTFRDIGDVVGPAGRAKGAASGVVENEILGRPHEVPEPCSNPRSRFGRRPSPPPERWLHPNQDGIDGRRRGEVGKVDIAVSCCCGGEPVFQVAHPSGETHRGRFTWGPIHHACRTTDYPFPQAQMRRRAPARVRTRPWPRCARSAGARPGAAWRFRHGAASRAGASDATSLADAAERVPAREQARWVRRRRADKPLGPAEHRKA